MKSKICLLLFTLSLFSKLDAQDEIKINWDYRNMTFEQFVVAAENQYDIRFFFRDEWVSSLKPGNYPGIESLTEFLDKLFSDASLFYFIDDAGNVVITKNFAVKIVDRPVTTEEGENYIPPTDYDKASEEDQAEITFFDIGNPADRNKPGNVMISGYVTDRDTKEPIAGTTIFVEKLGAGTITNEFGHFNLTLPRGSHLLQFSFIGMKEKQVNINLYGEGDLNIEMNSVLIPLKETVVSAQKNVVLQRYETGVEKIDITAFKLLPTSMGESDIIKSILLVPGIQSVGEGSAGFNVRGGSSDQNLLLLYGAPVYNSSHFFGFFSAVNSDVISDVTLYKGGIPSRYGGRISSVLDIGTKNGNWREFEGNAGISPITTHLRVEGPVIRDTLSYILSGRTTYSNWVLGLVDNPALSRSRASFYDFNGKITYDINRNNRIEVASYLSHDDFRFNTDTVYAYDNQIIALNWRHFFSSRFFSNISVNNSNYKYEVSSDKVPTEGFLLSHKINSTGAKADFNWYEGRHEFNFGLDLTRYAVTPGSYSPYGDSSLVITKIIPEERALESALYIEDKYVLTDYLSLNAGIRFSTFFANGPRTVFVYDPDYTKSNSTIIDTLKFTSGQLLKTYAGPEFRVSLNFRTSPTSSIKVNYNRTRQHLHMLSNTTSISPTDTWKLSDYYLKPQVGNQYSAGFYQMLFNNTTETSVELYYKHIKDMVDFKGGTNLVMNDDIETDLVNVLGRAYGVELMIKKTIGKIRYSVAYTYSRTLLKSTGTFSDEVINGGEWFPANFDKPNDLIVTFNYLVSRRFSFSANYTWSTGRPITYPIATYKLGDMLLMQYSDRNKYRLPDYMRLDLSATISGNLKSKKIAHPHWIFSVYNVLGRRNVYSVYFVNEYNRIKGYKLSIFGQAIPSVSFNFDF
jgi:hypothetical protein